MMHLAHSPRLWLVLTVVGVALWTGSCSKKQDTVTGNPPPTDTTVTGASITDEARQVSLNAVTVFFRRLPGTDPAADRQAVLAYFKTRPEFEASGLSPDGGNVWARYTDGRLLMYVNNRKPGAASSGATVMGGPTPIDHGELAKSTNAFPGSSTARIINSFGTNFPDSKRTADSIRTWCKLVGYSLSSPNIATITNLKLMKGDGIFYWASHGGLGTLKNNTDATTFSMWTSEFQSPQGEIDHLSDLNTFKVHYMFAANNRMADGSVDSSTHYSVTGEFIKTYMAESFAKNCLIYFDACHSSTLAAGSLPLLSFYLGWNNEVYDDDAADAALYFFDKALGVNRQTPKASPPERAFFTGSVLRELTKKGLNSSGGRRPDDPIANLVHPFEPVEKAVRILVPSITLTSEYRTGVYYVDGDFSDTPGTGGSVLLNEKPLTITDWTDSGIKTKMPETGGALVVTIGTVRSNPVNLTEWHGRLEYTYKGRGSLLQKIYINLDFWGDVHWSHQDISQPSIYSPIVSFGRDVHWMTTSSCTFECSGEYRDEYDVVQESWTGGGSYPLVPSSLAENEFSCTTSIDYVGLNSTFNLRVPGKYARWTKATGFVQTPLNMQTAYLALEHDSDFILKGGTKSIGGGTLTWNDFATKYAPDPKAAQ